MAERERIDPSAVIDDVEESPAAPRTRRGASAAVAQPTGKGAPTDPPTDIDPRVQAAMELTEPAPGFVLARLVTAETRQARGLPADSVANITAAMVEVIRLHRRDDMLTGEYPPGTTVVVSLEGIAPLLDTLVFLVPAERIQGRIPPLVAPLDPSSGPSLGFR